MTAEDFIAWLDAMRETRGWTDRRCAEELGAGHNQPARWKRAGAPKYIGLACAAIAQDLKPWTPSRRPR